VAWYHIRIYPLERDTTPEVEAEKRPELAEVFRFKLRCKNQAPGNWLMIEARKRAEELGWDVDPFNMGTKAEEDGYRFIAYMYVSERADGVGRGAGEFRRVRCRRIAGLPPALRERADIAKRALERAADALWRLRDAAMTENGSLCGDAEMFKNQVGTMISELEVAVEREEKKRHG